MAVSIFAGCGASDNGESSSGGASREEKTLMVGDSLFDLWKSDCATDLEGAKNLVNIAIGGTSSLYWQKGYKLVEREMPTTIIMCLGTNDIADLSRTGEGAARGGDDYDTSLQGVLEKFHEIVPDAYIYCLTINICGENIRWNKRAEISICNQLMRDYCADKDWVEMVETEHAFYDDDNYMEKPNADYFVSDYLHFSKKGYTVLKKIVREAIGLDTKTEDNVAQNPERTVLIGDSLFDFWDDCYEHLSGLKDCYNIGVGGTTAAYWLEKIDRPVALNPDKLVICIGTNDIVGKTGKNCAQDNTGIQKLLEKLHERLSDTQIYLLTINICGEKDRWAQREAVVECNQLMRTYCSDKAWVEIIETEYAFYDDDDYTQKPAKKYFWDDHLHFSASGYEILTSLIRTAIGLD